MLKNCTIYRYTIHEVKSSTPECLIPIPTVTIPLGHGSLQNAIYLHIPPIAEVRSLIFLNDIKIAGGKKKKLKKKKSISEFLPEEMLKALFDLEF